jgi:hypothetical protein
MPAASQLALAESSTIAKELNEKSTATILVGGGTRSVAMPPYSGTSAMPPCQFELLFALAVRSASKRRRVVRGAKRRRDLVLCIRAGKRIWLENCVLPRNGCWQRAC